MSGKSDEDDLEELSRALEEALGVKLLPFVESPERDEHLSELDEDQEKPKNKQ